MEIKAKLKNVYENIIDDCTEAVFEVPTKDLIKLVGQDVRLKVVKWHDKRSLDSNAYLWFLATKLAEVLKTSKEEIYEEFIQKYGYTDEPPIVLTVKSEVNMDVIEGHWKYLRESADGRFKAYMRLRGTSEYDKKEMAHFLDMVIEDCKEQGIETLTSDELERIKELWKGGNQ